MRDQNNMEYIAGNVAAIQNDDITILDGFMNEKYSFKAASHIVETFWSTNDTFNFSTLDGISYKVEKICLTLWKTQQMPMRKLKLASVDSVILEFDCILLPLIFFLLV